MKIKVCIFILLMIITCGGNAKAQIRVSSKNITVNDSITVYYNPTLGNRALCKVDSIYLYTGLITLRSKNKLDWQYVPMQWGESKDRFKLTRINDTCYYFGINIKKIYNPIDDEFVSRIALLFHNSNYSKIGLTEDNEYSYIDLVQNGFNFKSYSIANKQLKINTDLFQYTVDLYDNNLVKVDFHKNDILSVSQTISVLKKLPNIKFDVIDNDSNLVFQNEKLKTIIEKKPVSFTFIRGTDTVIKNLRINNNFGWHYEYDSTSRIYGGGSNTQQLDRNNKFILLYSRSYYGYTSDIQYSNCTIPFFISSDLYSIYFDSPSKADIDLGKTSKGIAEYYSFSTPSPVYIEVGDSCEELVSDFTSLAGRPPLPAYWTLGFIQSNYGYWNQFVISERLPLYKQYQIPCEAIMMDFYWSGGKSKMGDYDWDYGFNFPNPTGLLNDIKNSNMKSLLISHVYVTEESKNFHSFYDKGLFATNQDGTPFMIENFWDFKAGLIDLFNPAANEELWNLYKARYDEGITGWWCDLSEPEVHPESICHFGGYTANEIHNIYPYLWAELLFNKFSEYKPNERPVHFFRGGFTGMQKFGCLFWTGDVKCSFDGMRTQIPMMLSLGICGLNMAGSDVGGFLAEEKNSLLYTRWIQYAAFSPILRPHSNGVQPPEPFYHDEPYLSICRNYINLRYKLLPYIYTLCYDATISGRPLVMQMDYFEIQNKDLQNINNQYYFGKDFIIAPILNAINQRKVVLPKGIWYEYKYNKRLMGGQTITVDYDINDIPIFVRAGAIIPTTYTVLSTELFKYDYYKFLCYADSSITESEGKMYVDDGKNPKSLIHQAYELINVKMINHTDKLSFKLEKDGKGFKEFSDAVFEMQVFNTKFFESVFVNNVLLPLYSSLDDFGDASFGEYYNTKENTLHIKFKWNHQKENLIECVRSANVVEKNKIEIYPNPTNGKITINLADTDLLLGSINMTLYSENGDKISSFESNKQKIVELDLSKYKIDFGVYFIEVKLADKIMKYKIIYER